MSCNNASCACSTGNRIAYVTADEVRQIIREELGLYSLPGGTGGLMLQLDSKIRDVVRQELQQRGIGVKLGEFICGGTADGPR